MHIPYKIPTLSIGRTVETGREVATSPTKQALTKSVSTWIDRPAAKRIYSPPNVLGMYEFQIEGVEWLRSRERALLGDEMGLGKTVQFLRGLDTRDRAIMVCPASLRLNWEAECQKWRPDLDVRVVYTPENMVPRANELVVLSFETLPVPAMAGKYLLPVNLRDVTVGVDEAHYAKDSKADRTIAVTALIAQAGRSWMMTGTPLVGRPLDLFGLLKTGRLFFQAYKNWDNFLTIFGGKRNRWGGYVFKDGDLDAAHEGLARVMLRRKRSEVLSHLPPKTYTHIPVEIGSSSVIDNADKQWQLYGATELPPFEMMSAAIAELSTAKIPAMLAQVERFEEEQTPLLVFSPNRAPIMALTGRKGWAVIHGDVPVKERHALVKKFQSGKLAGLGLTIDTGGVGLTLTHAAHALFVGRDYTPGLNDQAEDRMVRIGQLAQAIHILVLVGRHPLDERLTQILEHKQRLIAGVVG